MTSGWSRDPEHSCRKVHPYRKVASLRRHPWQELLSKGEHSWKGVTYVPVWMVLS